MKNTIFFLSGTYGHLIFFFFKKKDLCDHFKLIDIWLMKVWGKQIGLRGNFVIIGVTIMQLLWEVNPSD